jgi:hypothetical protein
MTIYIVAWQLVDAVTLTPLLDNASRRVYFVCRGDSDAYLGALIGAEGACLLYGVFLSRKVSAVQLPSDYNELSGIVMSIYISFVLGIVLVPVLFAVGGTNPVLTAIVENSLDRYLGLPCVCIHKLSSH